VYVLVTADDSTDMAARATVADAANLRQLHAEFRGVDDPTAGAALAAAGLGTVDGDHAWLPVAELRAAGGGSASWLTDFDAMVKYAAGKGWSNADGSALRAHIIRS
jgi:hypothetical protein